jgi:methionyl aminopeptidase
LLKAGMTIAIEPMATLGSDHVELDEDGWLWRTVDGSWSAQFEHTVLVTETGAEILTKL